MKKIFACVAFAVGLSCAAQDSPPLNRKNGIDLSLGLTKLSLLDELNSPLVYRSTPKTIRFSYQRNGAKAITRTGLMVGRGGFLPAGYKERTIYNTTYDFDGNATKDSFMLGGALLMAKIHLHYLRMITEGDKWQLHIGGGLNHHLYYPDSFVRTGYMNSFSFSLNVNVTYLMDSRNSFSGFISSPVIAYNTRFPYHSTLSHPEDKEVEMFFSQGSKLTSVHQFQQMEAGLEYRHALSKRWDLSVNYLFSRLNYQNPERIKLFYNQLQAGITLKF